MREKIKKSMRFMIQRSARTKRTKRRGAKLPVHPPGFRPGESDGYPAKVAPRAKIRETYFGGGTEDRCSLCANSAIWVLSVDSVGV